MVKGIVHIILLLISFSVLTAEDIPANKLSSYEGLHFMLGFMENESNLTDNNKQLDQKIFVSSNYDATLQVRFGSGSPVQYNVLKDEIISIIVPKGFENYTSEVVKNNLIEITSDLPIAVYAYSSIPRSTDSYAAIPVSNWGKEYIAVSLPNDQYNKITLDSVRDFTPRSSEILIMSAYDGTKVTIIPTALTRKLKQVGQSYEITLNRGECYLVQSWQYARGQGDLTGTVVRSDKPVGFLSGHVRTALMQGFVEQPPDSKDHLIEMLMPTTSWGRTFVSIPFGTNPDHGDYFKIVSKDKNTIIDVQTVGNVQQIKFNGADFQVLAGLNEPALWRSSSPVQLAQFMYRTGDINESVFYDPSMVVLPPVEQFVSKIIFNTPDESFMSPDGVKFNEHYVTLVAEPQALPNLKLDNILVIGISGIELQTVPGTNLHWARILVKSGKHELISSEGRFAGVLFGIGRFDSYAMTLGCSLQNPFTDDKIDPVINITEDCGILSGIISDEISDSSYGIYYAWVVEDSTYNYDWKINPVSSDADIITFNAQPKDKFADGRFMIDYFDKSGNTKRYVYNYDAVNLSLPQEIILPDVDYHDSICYEFKVKNNGKKSIELLSMKISSDPRIALYITPPPPFNLQSGDEVTFRICMKPMGDTSSFYGKLNLNFDCDIKYEIPYRGNLIALELEAKGVDFGEVQLGTMKCDSISITNTGNSEVLLTGLEFGDIFQFDTLSIFPHLLNAGETFKIIVCFSPEERKDYLDEVFFVNEFGLKIKANVKGTGVAPLLNNLQYDFGKARVGTSVILQRIMNNTGNQDALISFDNFINKSHSDDGISTDLENIINQSVLKQQSISKSLEFIPSDTMDYSIKAKYKTNWTFHPELTISATGKGTIPVIITQDVDFGSIYIYDTKQLTPDVILSQGNEKLTVDKIFVSGGDSASFLIDYTLLENLSIDEKTAFSTPILFKPERLGLHEITLGVIHDAMPNYKRDTAYFKVSGLAIAPDSYDIEILSDINTIFACQYSTGKLKIKNNGKKIEITGLQMQKIPDNFMAEILDFKPAFIESGESVEYSIRIFADRGIKSKLKVTATFFEVDNISTEFDIIPVAGKVIIDKIPEISYAAGDTVNITLKGKFDSDIDTLTSFYLSLGMDFDHLMLLGENFSLNLINFNENLKYNLNISKTRDKLEFFISEDLIKIFKNLYWSIDLTFLGLLSDQTKGNWKISASSDKCFEPSEEILPTILDSVCVFGIRHPFVDNEKFHVNIYPNPVESILRLKTMYPENAFDGKISITDNLGITYTLGKNVHISTGTNFLEYDISSFPNGTYQLRFESEFLTKNILFVIIR